MTNPLFFGIYDSDPAWWPDWNEVVLHHAGSTFVVVFVEECSLRVLAFNVANSWCKCHLSDVVRKCMDQWFDHQWHHTTCLKQRDVGSCFWQLHVDYHNPINGSFFVLLAPSQVEWALLVNKMLWIIWGLELIQWHNSNRLYMSACWRCWMWWMRYGYIPSVCSVH